EVYRKRLEQLQANQRDEGWQAALIMQPRDLYYYAGTAQPANLWVPEEGDPTLFTRRVHELTGRATWIDLTVSAGGFGEMSRALAERGLALPSGAALGVEQDVLPYRLVEGLKRHLEGVVLQNVSPVVLRQRLVKDAGEVARIRKAVELWETGHEAIMETLAVGAAEYEVAAAMEYAARMGGGDGTVWPRRWDSHLPAGGIVASGPNAWVVSGEAMTVTGVGLSQALPWGPSSRRLEAGDLVVVDFTLSYEGYHCDMTRTYCVGEPTREQRDLWERLLEIHLQVVDEVRPGVTGEELYLLAKGLAQDVGLIDNFMGVGSERGSYIGHSIGLELDEWPVLGAGYRVPLPVGAVITIEPKFMVPGVGAVMVEDDILVTPDGHEVLGTLERKIFVP
ncbi:MAG: M24 family metallopeptidase, partial [Rubrobacter sp.]